MSSDVWRHGPLSSSGSANAHDRKVSLGVGMRKDGRGRNARIEGIYQERREKISGQKPDLLKGFKVSLLG